MHPQTTARSTRALTRSGTATTTKTKATPGLVEAGISIFDNAKVRKKSISSSGKKIYRFGNKPGIKTDDPCSDVIANSISELVKARSETERLKVIIDRHQEILRGEVREIFVKDYIADRSMPKNFFIQNSNVLEHVLTAVFVDNYPLIEAEYADYINSTFCELNAKLSRKLKKAVYIDPIATEQIEFVLNPDMIGMYHNRISQAILAIPDEDIPLEHKMSIVEKKSKWSVRKGAINRTLNYPGLESLYFELINCQIQLRNPTDKQIEEINTGSVDPVGSGGSGVKAKSVKLPVRNPVIEYDEVA